ncbi:MAG: hypothetical protein L0K65_01375 [Actinomyces sp.]|nr:hypothetical protein [Actinomyces sp.]
MTTHSSTASPVQDQNLPTPNRRRRRGAGHYLVWACLIIILVITVFPFYWMLRSSFTTNSELITNPGALWPESPPWTPTGGSSA